MEKNTYLNVKNFEKSSQAIFLCPEYQQPFSAVTELNLSGHFSVFFQLCFSVWLLKQLIFTTSVFL